MIRLVLILVVFAAPALAQTRPLLRPDDLGLRVAVAVEETVAEQMAPDQADLAATLIAGLEPCWNLGGLSPDAQEVEIVVGFEMTPDATPIRDTIRMVAFNQGTQEAADEALGAAFRAIVRCGQDGLDLPADRFAQWQRVEVRFDASQGATR